MNQKIKISQLPAKGSNLAAADLLEIAEFTGTGYISKSITGQEIIDAIPVPPSGITIGTTAITSGTVGRVLFDGTGNVVQESANLFWDNTNGRLGIGTSSPINTLHVVGGQLIKATADGFESIKLQNFANTYPNTISFYKSNGTTQTVVLGDNGASVAYPFITGMRADYGFVGNKNSGFHIFAGTNIAQTIHTTGNIGINTTTDAGFRLDVNGTARVVGPTFAVGDWTNRSTSVYVRALTGGSENRGFFIGTGASNDGNVGSFTYQPTGNLLNIRSPYNSGTVALSFEGNTNSTQFHNTSGTAVSKFFSNTGNWGINTTTDAGFRLDVNGTARVQGQTTITPPSVTGALATSSLDIAQTWNTTGAPIGIKLNITDTASNVFSDLMNLQVGGSAKFRILKSGYFLHSSGGEIAGSVVIGNSSVNASAQLQVDSTVKGFLPPRMTTTQKNAIATPATGLMVYDTTLNLISVYNGTTWITL